MSQIGASRGKAHLTGLVVYRRLNITGRVAVGALRGAIRVYYVNKAKPELLPQRTHAGRKKRPRGREADESVGKKISGQ